MVVCACTSMNLFSCDTLEIFLGLMTITYFQVYGKEYFEFCHVKRGLRGIHKCHAPAHPLYLIRSFSTCLSGLGGSVGCVVRLETRRSRVAPRSATFFRGYWSWNIFYGHSLPSADSRRAVVSFWRKNVHNTG